jgi:hypothetical protein
LPAAEPLPFRIARGVKLRLDDDPGEWRIGLEKRFPCRADEDGMTVAFRFAALRPSSVRQILSTISIAESGG